MTETTGFNEERSRSYDDRITRLVPGYPVLHKLSGTILAEELPENASLLIAGVGTGMEILDWGPAHPHWQFTAVDPAPTMTDLAKTKLEKNGLLNRVTLQTGTVDQLPEDILFDAATLLLVLHFIPDDQKAELLSGIAARLNPGAPFLIATLFGDAATTRYKKIRAIAKAWAISEGIDPQVAEDLYSPTRPDMHVVPEERLKGLLREAGFIDVQRYYQAAAIGAWMARAPR